MEVCRTPVTGRRRTFWSTQPCDIVRECGDNCETHGIKIVCNDQLCRPPSKGASISTDNWIRGLALNILLTDGKRPDTFCGWRPGSRGGHWSDSFRDNIGQNLTSGSLAGTLQSHGTVTAAVAELRAILQNDMQKLVTYGVAESVSVDVKYLGANKVSVDIDIFGVGGEVNNVGIVGQRSENSWLWDL